MDIAKAIEKALDADEVDELRFLFSVDLYGEGGIQRALHRFFAERFVGDLIWAFLYPGRVNINQVTLPSHHTWQGSLLHYAAWKGSLNTVKFLLKFDIDVNSKTRFSNLNALNLAAANKHLDLVEWLVRETDADLTSRDERDRSVLHYVATVPRPELLKFLLRSNAIELLNATDNRGYTGLHYAAVNGRVEIVNLLLQQPEIDVSVKNKYGFTAYEIAEVRDQYSPNHEQEYKDIIRLLKEHAAKNPRCQ